MAEAESSVSLDADDENPSVWSALPKEVLHMVLSHLPIKSLCQMRCVCKEWRDVLRRRDFHQMYDTVNESQEPSPAICYVELSYPARIEWSSYDFAAKKWIRMSGFTSRPSLYFNPLQRHTWPQRFYSVGGLLCFHFWKADNKSGYYMQGVSSWVVWQPFRNIWKKLPPCKQKLNDRGTCFVHAWVSDERAKTYKLLVAHDPRSHWDEEIHSKLVTEVYDSATRSWTNGSEYSLRFSEGYESGRHIRTGVLCNGVIYFSTGCINCVLLSYDISRDQWHEEGRNRNCNVIFEWDGRLMSIAAPDSEDFGGDFLEEDKVYVVVERNPTSGSWEETGIEIPFKVRRKFYSVVAISVVATGNDLAVFGNATDDSFKIAVYKRKENFWRIPPTGTFSDRFRYARVEGLVLHKPQVGWTP